MDKARNEFLAQKAKTLWLEEGDANTHYFHTAIKSRRIQNKVLSILDSDGKKCVEGGDIERAFLDYYKGLLGTNKERLMQIVTDEEIKAALFSIPANKSPGPNGYSSQFFRDSFEIIGSDVCQAVKEIFVNDFRPIIYNRVADILPSIISANQSAFIKGREIVDNILICQDLVRIYNRKACSPRGDGKSVKTILRAFITFSVASGLELNRDKSEFYCNGLQEVTLQMILGMSWFRLGNFTFKYLGIPISYKRIAIRDCSKLVERMVEKISGWGSRKLSYAGRLVLVKFVLSQVHSYWARIFIIPKVIIKRIESICHNYLWEGIDKYHKVPSVSWEKVCREKRKGGLGVTNSWFGTQH
ncbi:uncharacterized protein LOC141590244 [Silene latifolia]|uniref:uncharacterized protein LOC141590244 n=1 Tax=Silene latifolia TaxID=37657 RepID=UPI003D76DECB